MTAEINGQPLQHISQLRFSWPGTGGRSVTIGALDRLVSTDEGWRALLLLIARGADEHEAPAPPGRSADHYLNATEMLARYRERRQQVPDPARDPFVGLLLGEALVHAVLALAAKEVDQ